MFGATKSSLESDRTGFLGLQVWVNGNGGEEEAEGVEGADGPVCAGKGQPVQAGALGFQVSTLIK